MPQNTCAHVLVQYEGVLHAYLIQEGDPCDSDGGLLLAEEDGGGGVINSPGKPRSQ